LGTGAKAFLSFETHQRKLAKVAGLSISRNATNTLLLIAGSVNAK
jgi:hypothetical protein